MIDRIDELRREGEAAVAAAASSAELEDTRLRYLGRKAELPNLLRGVAQLPPEERGRVGRSANEARHALEAAIEQRRAALAASELEKRLAGDVVDVTLPASPAQPVGRLHLLTAVRRELEDVFIGLGFRVVEGPEVDTVYTRRGCRRTPSTSTRTSCCACTPHRCRSGRWSSTRRRCTS
jgi:phenylalanyl-tRNA synthetase alpha chain